MNLPAALTPLNTVLVVIDVQDRLFRVMHDKERLLQNLQKLVKGVRVLEVPVILTEQYPAGLGPTLPELAQLLPEVKPIDKVCFSCCTMRTSASCRPRRPARGSRSILRGKPCRDVS
jgi:nicotinamidase-related amidase